MKKHKGRVILWGIKKWLLGLLGGLCLVYLLCLCMPKLFGIRVGVVKSGSMEPSIATGSIVYVRPDPLESIQTGDVIAFQKETITVIHRVVGLDERKEGYVTKGDNNETKDASPVPFSKVIGRVIFHIPYMGYFSAWIEDNRGFLLWILFCFLCAFLLEEAVKVWFQTKHGEDSKRETEQIRYIG